MNSMTGFGAATASLKGASLRVEISSVNRKQAEIVVQLPRAWTELETRTRELVAARVSRGRITVAITLQNTETNASPLMVRASKLRELTERLDEVQALTGQAPALTLDALLRLNIIAEGIETDLPVDEVWETLHPALEEALGTFLSMRAKEGENLRCDLLQRVETLHAYRSKIAARAPEVSAHYREALLRRLAEINIPIAADDERLLKEIAVFADKCDVSEELTRLSSHLEQFVQYSNSEDAVGRTLDFLCQEIFRELNTTGSKANNAELAQLVVAAKTELEKIREQVQNVE